MFPTDYRYKLEVERRKKFGLKNHTIPEVIFRLFINKMRGKSYSKRTLSNRDASYLKFSNKLQKYSRFLNKKAIDVNPPEKPKLRTTEINLSPLVSDHGESFARKKEKVCNIIPQQNKHTQESQKNALKDEIKQVLTKGNLKKLQEEIFAKELTNISCHHCLCSVKNRKNIKHSRLWFLFELEMSEDWNENLRLDCYNKYVYSAIDESWMMENILLKKQEKHYEYFPIQQLLIPHSFESFDMRKKPKNIEDLTVNIDSIIETNHQAERFLPESILIKRENDIAFDDFQLDAKKILNDLSATSENPFGSSPCTKKPETNENNKDTIPKKKNEKRILGALEKKLHINDNY
ncbi:hypothetical protein SKDZ_05G1860 [Saccharomyces kudriavzevii ZP591]|nr:hypothetical protein SKDZ_05G1860 [Saccharomyces kudriavzevii ZP591]